MELDQSRYLNTKVHPLHDFQILGKEISDFVGRPAYFLFAKYNHAKIRDAFYTLQKKNNHSLPYLVGIIKRL